MYGLSMCYEKDGERNGEKNQPAAVKSACEVPTVLGSTAHMHTRCGIWTEQGASAWPHGASQGTPHQQRSPHPHPPPLAQALLKSQYGSLGGGTKTSPFIVGPDTTKTPKARASPRSRACSKIATSETARCDPKTKHANRAVSIPGHTGIKGRLRLRCERSTRPRA